MSRRTTKQRRAAARRRTWVRLRSTHDRHIRTHFAAMAFKWAYVQPIVMLVGD